MVQPQRPKGCPLFLHGNGQWCRKVKGKAYYFGSDFAAALKRWADAKDHILAGEPPPRKDGRATLAELANLYLADSRQRVKAGDVRADHTAQVKVVLDIIVGAVGGTAKPDLMTPAAWSKVRQAIATTKTGKRTAQTTLKVRLAKCRAFINWCVKNKHVKSVDTADALAPPAKRLIKREENARGDRLWDPSDLQKVIAAASAEFRAVLLLGINAGMGSLDIAMLTRSQWKPGQEFLTCPRNKTGQKRRIWLWQETREALATAVAKRAEPARQRFADRLLLSGRGYPWSRVEAIGTLDATRTPLAAAKAKAGVKVGCFYDLRRSFRTAASEVCDLEAIDYCMGHAGEGEGATYLRKISDDRVKRVCEHVRSWLYGRASNSDATRRRKSVRRLG